MIQINDIILSEASTSGAKGRHCVRSRCLQMPTILQKSSLPRDPIDRLEYGLLCCTKRTFLPPMCTPIPIGLEYFTERTMLHERNVTPQTRLLRHPTITAVPVTTRAKWDQRAKHTQDPSSLQPFRHLLQCPRLMVYDSVDQVNHYCSYYTYVICYWGGSSL